MICNTCIYFHQNVMIYSMNYRWRVLNDFLLRNKIIDHETCNDQYERINGKTDDIINARVTELVLVVQNSAIPSAEGNYKNCSRNGLCACTKILENHYTQHLNCFPSSWNDVLVIYYILKKYLRTSYLNYFKPSWLQDCN